MNIGILNQQKIAPVKKEWIRGIVRRVLKAEGVKADEVSIVFCDDAFIHELNKRYRGIDGATDVLSFSLTEGEGGGNTPKGIVSLGEVIISVETAARQAEECHHPIERELEVLLIHGVLHLIGYDHSVEDWEQGEMYERQMGLLG
ncbi:rRNA maturation RNase YbeY [Candidatus Desantisbacteria bacterium]|nr:rRNA maturation RNase YbeY [Candidatus Desantisbacteria bacterium]